MSETARRSLLGERRRLMIIDRDGPRPIHAQARNVSGLKGTANAPHAAQPARVRQPRRSGQRGSGDPAAGHSRKTPDSTAFAPAVRSTTIGTVSPAATEIGTLTHAPWLKLPDNEAVWPATLISSRRAVESQSSA